MLLIAVRHYYRTLNLSANFTNFPDAYIFINCCGTFYLRRFTDINRTFNNCIRKYLYILIDKNRAFGSIDNNSRFYNSIFFNYNFFFLYKMNAVEKFTCNSLLVFSFLFVDLNLKFFIQFFGVIIN